jgi:hypothetical protein
MDAVAFHINEWGHIRIPFSGEVSKVDPVVEEFFNFYLCHFCVSLRSVELAMKKWLDKAFFI